MAVNPAKFKKKSKSSVASEGSVPLVASGEAQASTKEPLANEAPENETPTEEAPADEAPANDAPARDPDAGGEGPGEDAPLAKGDDLENPEGDDPNDIGQHPDQMERACTDVLCLIVFLFFLGLMGYIQLYSFGHGNIAKLTHGIDWTGEVCGYGENVSDMPFLFWCGKGEYQNITATVDGQEKTFMRIPRHLKMDLPICLESCPSSSLETVYCPQDANVTKTPSGTFPEITWTTVTVQAIRGQSAYATKARAGKYCMPDVQAGADEVSVQEAMQALQHEIDQWIGGSWTFAITTAIGNLAADLPRIIPLMVLIVVAAFVLSFNYLIVLRRCALFLIYGCFIFLCVCFLGLGVFAITTAHHPDIQHMNPLIVYTSDAYNPVLISDIIGVVALIIGLLTALAIWCLRETIQMVAGVIEASSEAIFDMPFLLFQPVLAALLKMSILVSLIYGFCWVVTLGEVATNTITIGGQPVVGLGRGFTYTEDERNMLFLFAFGIFWIMEVFDAAQQFTVSYAVVLWYYKPIGKNRFTGAPDKKSPFFPVIRGVYNALFWHLGTLAFGGLLIAVVKIIQLILWLVKKQAEHSGNQAGACLAKCCMCCLECFKRCLEYINKMAYVDVAIKSSNFMQAAYHVFQFISSEAPAIAMLNSWTFVAQVGGVLSITFSGGYSTHLLLTKIDRWADESSDHFVTEPTLLAGLAAGFCFAISTVFMWVFDQCCDTLLYIYADNRKHRPDTVKIYAPAALAELVDEFEARFPRSKPPEENEEKKDEE